MQQRWFRWMMCSALVAGMAMLTSCDGGGGGEGNDSSGLPPAQVAGTWKGDLSYNVSAVNKSGTLPAVLTISQNGNDLSGDVDGYAFSGTVDGNSVSLSAPAYDLQGLKVEMSVSGTFDGTAIVDINGKAKAKGLGITLAEGTVHSDQFTRVQ